MPLVSLDRILLLRYLLQHSNQYFVSAALYVRSQTLRPGHVVFRPLCYATDRERLWRTVCCGGRTALFTGDMRTIFDDIERIAPTQFSAPPRVWNMPYDAFHKELTLKSGVPNAREALVRDYGLTFSSRCVFVGVGGAGNSQQVVDDVDDRVLLTGATGFVGSHIAVALLAATQSSRLRISCVVRAESDAEARTRLVSTLVKICSDASVIAQDPRLVAIALPSSCDDPGRAVAILLDIRRRCDVTHVARP